MKYKSFIIILLVSLSMKFANGQSHQPIPDTIIQKIHNNFLKDKQAVGLSIGVYQDGTSFFYNFGTVNKNTSALPTKNTIYEIGSITKGFVSLVLAHAVIEKRVRLTDDIRIYLDGSYPNLEYNSKPITLEQLANTTSGIPNWLPVTPKEITDAPADSAAFLRNKIYSTYSRKDFYEALHQVTLDTVPGFKVRHSNAASQLLSYILEGVYKKPINQLVKKYILVPNKMYRTSFIASEANAPGLATGYDGNGKQMPYFTSVNMQGVGGLNSTAADLVNFIKLQLGNSDSAVMLSHKHTVNAGWFDVGLNWNDYKFEDGNHQLWLDGGTYGFASYIIIYPEINSGIVVLSNESDESTPGKISDIADLIYNFMKKKN